MAVFALTHVVVALQVEWILEGQEVGGLLEILLGGSCLGFEVGGG